MNKRIRELAEQAFFDETTSQASDKMYTFTDHKMQQFAQLIVAECVDACRSQAAGAVGTHASAHNSAIGACISAIQQRFDVSCKEKS